ncbi:hypothetical protein [Amycolatopsis sp. NPDC059657]|uniref:hypothetical protein n=1 Tax=Amycolatopsis sp. NPDC059657 TaxID=3346899 RepID=UPI0036725FEC
MDERTAAVSDPASPDYDPNSPYYDVTADSSSKYYVGPLVGDAESGDEIRERATADVDKQIADEEHWTHKVIDPEARDARIQRLYEQRLDEARRGLDAGLELRPSAAVPRTAWENASHEQMNDAIFKDANSATIAESSEEWVRVGNELAHHQRVLADAIADSTADWRGAGGDAVREHLAGVGKWLGVTAQGAALTGRQQQIHSQTLNETQKQMAANPPVAFSPQEANARLVQITDPVEYALRSNEDLKVYQAQQAGREQAARIMTQFDETVGSATVTPAFPPPPKLPGSNSTAGGGSSQPSRQLRDQPAGSDSGDTYAASRTAPLEPFQAESPVSRATPVEPFQSTSREGLPAQQFPPSAPPLGDRTGGPSFPGSPAFPDAPHLPTSEDRTRTAGFQPNPPPLTGGPAPTGIPPIPDTTTPRGTPYPVGGTPPPFPTGTGPTGAPPMNPRRLPTIGPTGGINGDSIGSRLGGPDETSGSRGGGAPKLGGGGGSTRGGAIGGFGPGSSPESSLTGGKGTASGPMGRAFEAEQVRGGAGPGAAKPMPGGPGGMGGAGAGKKGEEDKEHSVAEYIEGDKELFSSEEIVAPPVIGDWQNTDWR